MSATDAAPPSLSDAEFATARRALDRAATERLAAADLLVLIEETNLHRCLLMERLQHEPLAAEERSVIEGGIAHAEHRLREYGALAARHRRAMRHPDYPAGRPTRNLGPRFTAARDVDMLDLAQTVLGETATKRGRYHAIRCPFPGHEQGDRDPSLVIFGAGRGWHCFVCGNGGSSIDLVMKVMHFNATEALFFIEAIVDTHPERYGGETRS